MTTLVEVFSRVLPGCWAGFGGVAALGGRIACLSVAELRLLKWPQRRCLLASVHWGVLLDRLLLIYFSLRISGPPPPTTQNKTKQKNQSVPLTIFSYRGQAACSLVLQSLYPGLLTP